MLEISSEATNLDLLEANPTPTRSSLYGRSSRSAENTQMESLFVDFRAAFDTMDRKEL